MPARCTDGAGQGDSLVHERAAVLGAHVEAVPTVYIMVAVLSGSMRPRREELGHHTHTTVPFEHHAREFVPRFNGATISAQTNQ